MNEFHDQLFTFSNLTKLKTILFLASMDPLSFDRLSLLMDRNKKKKIPSSTATPPTSPPPLMYTVPYVTRDSKAAFYKSGTQFCFTGPPPAAHTACSVPSLVGCWVTGCLCVFCHTLEEFSICSTCDFSAPAKEKKKVKSQQRNIQDGRAPSLSLSLRERSCSFLPAGSLYRMSHMQTIGADSVAAADKGPSQTVREFKWKLSHRVDAEARSLQSGESRRGRYKFLSRPPPFGSPSPLWRT